MNKNILTGIIIVLVLIAITIVVNSRTQPQQHKEISENTYFPATSTATTTQTTATTSATSSGIATTPAKPLIPTKTISGYTTHTDATVGVAFQYPPVWKVIEFTTWDKLGKDAANIFRQSGSMMYTVRDLTEKTTLEAHRNKEAFVNINVTYEKETTIDGNPAVAFRFTLKNNDGREYYRYAIFKGLKRYVFDIAAPTKLSDADIKTFDQIMSTVKVR